MFVFNNHGLKCFQLQEHILECRLQRSFRVFELIGTEVRITTDIIGKIREEEEKLNLWFVNFPQIRFIILAIIWMSSWIHLPLHPIVTIDRQTHTFVHWYVSKQSGAGPKWGDSYIGKLINDLSVWTMIPLLCRRSLSLGLSLFEWGIIRRTP